MTIGTVIKRLRKGKGLKQGEFASLIKVDRSTLSRIESGKQEVSRKMLERIADYFDIPVALIEIQALDVIKIHNQESRMKFSELRDRMRWLTEDTLGFKF